MTNTSLTLGEVADRLAVECRGERSRVLTGLATLAAATPSQISFLANAKYRRFLDETRAGAVIVAKDLAAECPVDCLLADDPYLAYARVSQWFDNAPDVPVGIHPTAVVSPSARIDASAAIGPLCVIADNVAIGPQVSVGAGCIIGADSAIDARCRLHPRVTLMHGVRLGSGCTLHSGAVIGGDGFGFAAIRSGERRGEWERIAQLGGVRIGRNVSVGCNTAIDRGALDDTVLGDNVIVDNLVQIAHNVQIGEGTAIAGSVGIAGSAVIGAHCMIGGGAGIVGHVRIADGVQIQARAFIVGNIDQRGAWASGTGMMELREWRRNAVRFTQLDDMYKRIVELEKQLKNLSGGEAE
jgi:UDP-3-O-[3-hydroxymyristoyl] glucosamine N-acyltransferase